MQYEILSPVRYDNVHYDVGTLIELSAEVAGELLACGAIQPVHVPFSNPATQGV